MQIGSGEETCVFDFDKPLRPRGKNGVVWQGQRLSGEKVIVKWHKVQPLEEALPELPFVQRKKGRIEHEGKRFHIYEYVEGRDLQSVFENPDRSWKDPAFVLQRWKQCLQVLSGVHAAGFLHTDIKLSNWIWNEDLQQMHLIDLSSVQAYPLRHPVQRAYIFSSPEQYLGIKELVGSWSDVFSLGICFYMLFSRQLPYQSGHAAMIEQMQLAFPLPASDLIPAPVWEVLQKTCKKPAFQRPPAQLSKEEILLRTTENITERYTDTATLLAQLEHIQIQKRTTLWNLWKR